MKVSNNISIDYKKPYKERVYELTIECECEGEVMQVFKALHDCRNLQVHYFKDYDVAIISEAWRHLTKHEFIESVKTLLKK